MFEAAIAVMHDFAHPIGGDWAGNEEHQPRAGGVVLHRVASVGGGRVAGCGYARGGESGRNYPAGSTRLATAVEVDDGLGGVALQILAAQALLERLGSARFLGPQRPTTSAQRERRSTVSVWT